ncbi:hypothetical protein NXS19_012389 [Fusarium pseudograminearum]|nr:hypothetical protein NXS19_012389 [Fusarium pseudograminearum]
MLVFRASSSPSSTKTPVVLSPASLCRFHWPTVSEFPLDVWSLRRFFSFFSPLTINDSSNSFARCRSITRYDESETDDDFTDITLFDPSHSLSIAEKSLATSRNRRIPSFSVSGSVFHQHPLRALPVSAQPQPELQRQKHIQRVGCGLSLADHTSTHVFVRRTSLYLPSAVVLAAVPTTCFRRILYSPDHPPTPYRPP